MDWTVFLIVLFVCAGIAPIIIGWAWALDKVVNKYGRGWGLVFNLSMVGLIAGSILGFFSGSQP